MQHLIQTQHYIDGKWQKGAGKRIEILNKYSQEPIATLQTATTSQIQEAIHAAQKGSQIIKNWTAEQRSEQLKKLYQLLLAQKKYFIDLIVAEAGKPISYATTELQRALRVIEVSAYEALQLSGEVVPIDFDAGKGKIAFTRRFPVGIVSCITPFNFPLNLVVHKVAPALACGCAVLLKPSEKTPLTALALTKLIEEAGYPAGIFNTVVAVPPEAELLLQDERIAMFSFTGSDTVGWHLKKNVAHPRMKVALELGGNAPILVADTDNLKQVAQQVAYSAFLYAGQVCISSQIVFVVKELFEDFKTEIIAATRKIVSGNPAESATINSPMIDKNSLYRIQKWVKEAQQEGAILWQGGNILSEIHHIFEPTILTHVNSNSTIFKQEAFAPILIVEPVSDFEQGIKRCNATRYGLQVGIFTQNINRMKYAFEQLEYGGVILNSVPAFRVDTMPYGGIKDSGVGREGVKYAIQEMTEPKLLVY
jgi:glyceraldehyde-3-phosphate dehydrogenase (NADP+)